MKKIAVLGSTGSIGTQTLDVIRNNADKLKVISLVAFSNGEKLRNQCEEFAPQYSALIAEQGADCLLKAVEGADIAVVATRGIVALPCVLHCLEMGIDVALANKETLVCGGEAVMSCAKKSQARLIPVDSEHCAIWQCLLGHNSCDLDKILLTASGGPFRNLPAEQLHKVTAADALRHPTWNMGAKITVDSATMFNKALEVVEAHWLFDVSVEKIEITVHSQSVVHSMVQWQSGSISAQLAVPDMRLPISLALLGEYPTNIGKVDFRSLNLTFTDCDFEKFPCAKLGYEIQKYPPLAATVMNAANDVCVENFLQGKLAFDKFYCTIIGTVNNFAEKLQNLPVTVKNIQMWDAYARKFAQQLIDEAL